jgi:hypothetical protein
MMIRRLLSILLFCGISHTLYSQGCDFTIAQLKYGGGGDWYANPSSLPNLIAAVKRQTAIQLCDTVATTAIMDGRFFNYPFIYMTGHGDVHFSHEERLRLRNYLTGGGFLWADDNYGMDKSFRKEMKILFPENPMALLPRNHPMFSSVNKLQGLPKIHEHDGEPAQAFGIYFNNRLVILYTFSSDIGDGMEDLDVHKDGPELHALALAMGVNIVAWFVNPVENMQTQSSK